MNKIKAVIFDMDGLIIETESLQSKAFEKIIKEHGKIPQYRENGLIQQVGVRGDQDWKVILKKHQMEGNIEKLRARKREIYLEILKDHLFPLPGVKELLILLKNNNIKIALATGTIRSIAEYILKNLNIYDFFSIIIAGEDTIKGKPNPDVFLKAAEKLNISPHECLVLEDANPGVIAAKKAGMKVFAVPNEYTKNDDFSKADMTIKSLEVLDQNVLGI